MSNDNSADLPLPPQGSELHSRLNAGNGTVNIYHQWIPISSHTAKCDLCLEHNKSVCQRCSSCNRQLCRKCIHTARDDGVHNFKDSDLDWTPAAPVKRGPRAPLMSTASLSITGRPARPPTARSATKFKVYKPSAPLVPSWDRSDRAPSGSPAPSPGAGRARRSGTKRASGIKPGSGADDLVPAGGRPSVRLPVRSGTKRVRSDEEVSAPSTPKKLKRNEGPSTPVPSPKSGNSFFPKPVTPQAGGRVTIRINSDKTVQTASDTNTTQSSGIQTATTSSSTTTSTSATTSSSSANETSVTTSSSATALSSATSTSSFHNGNGNGNGNDGDDSNDDRRRRHTKVPATKDTIVKDFAVENFAIDNSVDDDLASKDFVIKAVPTKDAAVQISTVQKSAAKGPKNPRGKTKAALEVEERDKKNAWENNQILLDLRQSGQEDDARDMLDDAYALLDLSMGR
jgi:hypothetical protein